MAALDQAIVMQYEDTYDYMYQQTLSLLRPYMRIKTGVVGTMAAFAQLGASSATNITGERLGQTTWHQSPLYRRRAPKEDWEDAQALDKSDQLEILVDLEMGYARNAIMALERELDRTSVNAAVGTAFTGASGTTTSAFDTTAPTAGGGGGNLIPAGGAPMTVDKLKEAAEHLNARRAGVDQMGRPILGGRIITMTANQHRQLMDETEATSMDFIGNGTYRGEDGSSMPLVNGLIPRYASFDIKLYEELPLGATGAGSRRAIAWVRDAMGLAIWGGRRIWVGELPTMHLANGIIVQEHFGAVRIFDKGVIAIDTVES